MMRAAWSAACAACSLGMPGATAQLGSSLVNVEVCEQCVEILGIDPLAIRLVVGKCHCHEVRIGEHLSQPFGLDSDAKVNSLVDGSLADQEGNSCLRPPLQAEAMNSVQGLEILPSVERAVEIDGVVADLVKTDPLRHRGGIGEEDSAGVILAKPAEFALASSEVDILRTRWNGAVNEGGLM